MDIKDLLVQSGEDRRTYGDLHVLRFYSSFITVSNGKVLNVTEPSMRSCPLADRLYKYMTRTNQGHPYDVKKKIKKVIEEKISRFGFFTEDRILSIHGVAIPYGASEMMMYAMKKKVIDSAVLVCDGAGTVITDSPDMVQGIGARLNGIFFTSPVKPVIRCLESAGCRVLFPEAQIQQMEGVARAAELGYKNIAVTVNALMDEDLTCLREIEERYGVKVTVLVVCTTGLSEKALRNMMSRTDIVWSCASGLVRKIIGRKAVLQLSKKIPVFVLTGRGLEFVSAYASDSAFIGGLDIRRQYLVGNITEGRRMKMGLFDVYLREHVLPVRSGQEPALIGGENGRII